MAVYIALLRGINVGGKNTIKMADLKKMFESLGLVNVQTYIQSGNVLFKSDEEERTLSVKIEAEIKSVFGFAVPVVLRTAAEIEQIIENCPFSDQDIKEAESSEYETLYVALLSHVPAPQNLAKLNSYCGADDRYQIAGREVFLLFRHSVRDSKLAANLHRLDVTSTVRNFKTIAKLAELVRTISFYQP